VSRAAVFVDRDGVINELIRDPGTGVSESPLHPDEVGLIVGAAAALRRLAVAGWSLVGVSNQPAAAKGTIALAELWAVQERVLTLLEAEGVAFDGFRLCLHHPDGIVESLRGPCECRKPAPGMLWDAAASLDLDLDRSWMVGDTDSDVAAGRAAGCATILLAHPASAHKRALGGPKADHVAPDLATAAELIIATQAGL
jgi:D-glycero-D-manno-heptose 1,7-bisphosphate phosphatase